MDQNNYQIKNQIENLKKTIVYLESMIVEEKNPSNEVVPNMVAPNEVVPNDLVPNKVLRNKEIFIKKKVIKQVRPNDWTDALKRVSSIFKANNIRARVPDLAHFVSLLKMKKPISEYSDAHILKKKLFIDAMKRVSIIFQDNKINFTNKDLKIFLKNLKKEKSISSYTNTEIIQKKLEVDSLSSLLNL